MNILQLEYFLKLAELGSFRATAEALYVSQPAVSKQISLLEKEWGFSLFERGYRTAQLTESGEIMLDVLKHCGEHFENALHLATLKSKQFASEIKIGIPEFADMGNLHEILAGFQQSHPNHILKVKHAPMSMLGLDYPDGDFDLVINYERNMKNRNAINTITICRRRHTAIVSRTHPAIADKENPVFEDLRKQRVYVPAPNATDSSVTKDYCIFICNTNGFTPIDIEMLPNVESVLMAVKMGFGYAVLDDIVALPEKFDLVKLPTNAFFDLMIGWNRANKNPVVEELAKEIKARLVLGGEVEQNS